MKRIVIFFFILGCVFVHAQKTDSIIKTELIKKIPLNVDQFIGIDDFENIYAIKNNTFYKKTATKTLTYTNTQLGKITSIDIKNPLKILLFYKDFNTVLILDNNLNELTTSINFNNTSFSKNISFVSGSSNNNFWVYSLDDNTLQLYNYQTNEIKFTSQALSSYQPDFNVNKMLSSYKDCWLVGKNSILQFNEYGTFIKGIKFNDHTDVKIIDNDVFYSKNNQLYKYNYKSTSLIDIKDKISIQSFYVNKNDMYIFDGTTIFVINFIKN